MEAKYLFLPSALVQVSSMFQAPEKSDQVNIDCNKYLLIFEQGKMEYPKLKNIEIGHKSQNRRKKCLLKIAHFFAQLPLPVPELLTHLLSEKSVVEDAFESYYQIFKQVSQ